MTKILFLALLSGSLIWGLITIGVNPITAGPLQTLALLYILLISVPFWPIFYLEFIEFYKAMRDQRSEYMKTFYESQSETIVGLSASAIVLIFIYYESSPSYSWSAIDIAGLGFPLYAIAFLNFFKLSRLKTEKIKSNALSKLILMPLSCTGLIFAAWISIKNTNGKFLPYQSIWIQLSIFFNSFWFLITSAKILYFAKNGKIEIPEKMIAAIPDIGQKRLDIQKLKKEAESWNKD
ncbi:hypothetical protein HNQ50_001970 [Silvimonas terrae]|uniref:Uncharacterized protein n=1 Tax=Silvimonas terrae TaxID=300266 RepID=A0A840RE42_9NEIS|nr:hypothetical protein [Silvimonas terrae]MBB5191247.1 hypothetical protein [Silvimonas terrae]